jgi:predicted PurR-regulated permease PerM
MDKEVIKAPRKKNSIGEAWYQQPFFEYATGTLLTLTIIFLIYQVWFLITPVLNFISSLIAPILISVLFYYLLRPAVYFLETYHVPRVVTIGLLYLLIALLIAIISVSLGPLLGNQIKALANISIQTLENLQEQYQETARSLAFDLDDEIRQRVIAFLQDATNLLSQNLLDILGFLTRIATILAVIPFIVYYLLKSDHEFALGFLKHFPEDFTRDARKILKNVDETLASYITGLAIISLSVGILLFSGYLVIGLDYALVLALIAVIFNAVPFLGPFLAITPALLLGLTESAGMTLKVAIVFIVVQQIESNLLSPQILGQRLNIHPLTIILLLLAAGTLYGLVGLILATPLYAISKVLSETLYKIYRLRYPHLLETE